MRVIAERKLARRLGAAALLTGLLAGSAPASAEARVPARVAVLVGNSDYQSARLPDLPNAARDAAVLSHAMEGLGFSVIAAMDATAAEMDRLLARAQAEQPSETILFFFAGHAVGAGAETFLLPSDAPDPTSLERLTAHATKLSDIVGHLASAERATLIILDACAGDSAAAETDNAPDRTPDNVFLGFAAAPGKDAGDGAGENSPFTRAFLRSVGTPGLTLGELMARVGQETARLTFGRQIPWSRSTLRKEFMFRAAGAATRPGG